MLIRAFAEDDWTVIHPFFSRIVAAGDSYAYPDGLSPDEARTAWVAHPPGSTIVAVDVAAATATAAAATGATGATGSTGAASQPGGPPAVVVGTATMGPVRPGRGAHIATASFMVSPDHQGRGVGRALGGHVVDWARRGGYRGIQFNAVVETNTAAVVLWQDLGFEILATVPGAFDHREHGPVGLHVMFLDLAR